MISRCRLIFDEIQTYGRIGRFFAAEHFGVTPDMIVLGKGFGARLADRGRVGLRQVQGFAPDAEELHTFANNSVSQVAAAKLIEILENGVLENTRKMGLYLRSRLEELQKEFPEIGDIRQVGLAHRRGIGRDPQTKEPLHGRRQGGARSGHALGVIFGLAGPGPTS